MGLCKDYRHRKPTQNKIGNKNINDNKALDKMMTIVKYADILLYFLNISKPISLINPSLR
jgi:hypothetical protein